MEAKARNRRRSALTTTRKPLSDCTNSISISQSQSSPTKPKPKPYFRPKNKPNPTPTAVSAAAANDAADPSTPLPPPRTSSSGGDDNDDVLEIQTVYSRSQTADKKKGKEKTDAVPFNGYSADRLLDARNNINDDEDKARNRRRSTLTTTRKPLSDYTNTISISHSQSSSTIPKPKPKPYFQPKNKPNPTSTSVAAAGSANDAADPSTPHPPPIPSSSPGGDDNDDVLEIRTVYSRRQTADRKKGKEKTVAVPFSSYSADRPLNARNKRNDYEDKGPWEPHTVPSKKQRRTRLEQDASENTLQEYIQQQRAYFSEVDAFELPEEEVGSGSELD